MKILSAVKNRKGFSLVECVVALLLFSIVAGSVFTVFSTSRERIKQQNAQYKTELMAGNILAAYEGGNSSSSFKKRLNGLGLELNDSESFSKTIGNEGTGQYGFDTQNIPVAVPFSKISVKDGAATFQNESGGELVGFPGTYPDNKLQDPNWSTYFDESDMKYSSGSMTLSGEVNISGVGKCTYTYTAKYNGETELVCNSSNKNYGKASGTKKTGDFENYLLRNGYYLKCIYRKYDFSLLGTTHDYFYFQVFNAADNTPVRDGDGKCLFYYVTIATNDEVEKYYQGLYANMGNDSVKMYFDFDNITGGYKKGSIQYGVAEEGTAYNKIDFNDTLKDENGNNFKGKWYYFPWLVANTDKGTMVSAGVPNMTVNCTNHVPVQKYYEYTAKDNVKSDIYYALNASGNKEMLLYNSDGNLIFSYEGDSKASLQNLVSNCNFGINGKRNTQALYNGETYDKWYKKGAVPLWQITKVKFTDGGENGLSRIIFYGKAESGAAENEYITFNYSNENYGDFMTDRDAVMKFDGAYSNWYNYKKTYSAKNLKNINDETGLEPYKQYDKIKAQKLGTTSSEQMLHYYTVSNGTKNQGTWSNPKYNHTYTYYSYKITITQTVQLTGYKENSRSLEISRNGDTVTCTETVSDAATVKKTYTYSITAVDKNKTITTQDGSKKTPSTPPDALKNGTDVGEKFKDSHFSIREMEFVVDYDYTDAAWVLDDFKNSNPATAEDKVNDIVGGSSYSEIPADLDTNWDLAASPGEAALHTQATLSALTRTDDSYEVQIGSNTVFTARPTDFVVTAGAVSAGDTACTYDVVGGEFADIKAETYYITWTSGDITLIAVVTYSNYTKEFEIDGVKQKQEPKIRIWSMPKSEAAKLSDIKAIATDSSYNKYLYREYRKG